LTPKNGQRISGYHTDLLYCIVYPLLQIKNLRVDFVTEAGTTHAVNDISVQVNRGEIVAIVGESGSGKSVTALSILQLLSPQTVRYPSGEILFSPTGQDQINLVHQDTHTLQHIRGNRISMIFQEPMTSLNPVFTCGQQVMEAIRQHRHYSKKEARQKTIHLFRQVRLPDAEQMLYRYPHELSGGQKQRVMIAMAMCCEPALLICDEPTTALDVTVQKTILQLIKELQQSTQMGVIFITHDLGIVAEIADRGVVMYKGNVAEQGSIREIFNTPRHPYTKSLLACRPVLHTKGERLPVVSDFMEADEMANRKEKIPNVTSRPPNTKFAPGRDRKETANDPILRVQNLKVWFPSEKNLLGKPLKFTKAVNDVSFAVYKGETLGLVGESGCGKTTLGRAILRLIDPTGGKIIYNGIDLTAKKGGELKSYRKNLQIVFQDPYSSLNPRITIGDAITEPLKAHHIISSYRQRKEKVIELLNKVDLKPDHFNRYPHEFSGGQRQRIVIARALALNPSFLVCDESVSALDVSVQAQVLNLLNDLKKEFGFTIIFISHDLAVVHYISDRIMVMNKGKIEETGNAEEVFANPQSVYTKQLIDSIPKGHVA